MDIKYRLEAIAETEFRMNYDFDFANMSRENLQIVPDRGCYCDEG